METFNRFFGAIGRKGLGTVSLLGALLRMLGSAAYWSFIAPFRGLGFRYGATAEQMVRAGINPVPIVCLVLLFVGMILCFQMARVLEYLAPDAVPYVADAVGKAIILELGPLLTAVVMSGFIGAAIAAELGTMTVNEEVLALEVHALSPIRFLVVPRFWGAVLMIPCLTILADIVGVFGGFMIGTNLLGIPPWQYIYRTIEAVPMRDFWQGLIKSLAFSIVISLIACDRGLRVEGGAEGVGKATTTSVVLCIVYIIAVDCLLTIVFYYTWR
ncbi:MAG TPA: ABC transporter permease [Candidatus Brocadiia bacterium]|nr:ABC transporter permease [Candidatus Brocadiia bacterium]